MSYESSRHYRNASRTRSWKPTSGGGAKGNIAWGLPPGTYGKVTVNADGSLSIPRDAYIDDVIAFLQQAVQGNPRAELVGKDLDKVLDVCDAKAVTSHGYSRSPVEAALVWNRVPDE